MARTTQYQIEALPILPPVSVTVDQWLGEYPAWLPRKRLHIEGLDWPLEPILPAPETLTVDKWWPEYPDWFRVHRLFHEGQSAFAFDATMFGVSLDEWLGEYPDWLPPRTLHQEGGLASVQEASFFPVPTDGWQPLYPDEAQRLSRKPWLKEFLTFVDFSVPIPPVVTLWWTRRFRPRARR